MCHWNSSFRWSRHSSRSRVHGRWDLRSRGGQGFTQAHLPSGRLSRHPYRQQRQNQHKQFNQQHRCNQQYITSSWHCDPWNAEKWKGKSKSAKINIIITNIHIIIIQTRRKGEKGEAPDIPQSPSQTSSLLLLLFAPGGRVGKGEVQGEVEEQLLLSRPSLSPTAVFTG